MPQRTWMPRVTGRADVPDDVGRRAAASGAPDADRARLRRARAAARGGAGWVWPHWLQRQLDPRSPAFLPGGDLPYLRNLTQLDWATLGNLDSSHEATIDARGLVTPWPGGWSLDWWVGADDRWHVPAREAAVRQRLVGAAPVVETALRVPTGDAVHRAYAIRRSSAEGGGELVVVEVENRSKLPVALALGVRPYGPDGLAAVERVDLHDGTTVVVDGHVALLLHRPPARYAASAAPDGDSAATVMSGGAGERWPGAVRCPDGLAQAAFVYPLAHGASLRVALPLAPERVGRRGAAVAFPTAVPGAEQVAAGWQAQAGRGMRVELPDDRLAEAVDATRRSLLMRHDSALPRSFRDDALVLGALGAYGYRDEVAAALAGYPARQRPDGSFGGRDEPGANGAALWSLGRHWQLTRDPALAEMAETLARAAQWVERARHGTGMRNRGPRREGPALAGLLPARGPAGTPGGYAYEDDLWAIAGLRACAELLAGIDQAPAAAEVGRAADALWADVEASLAATATRLDTSAMPYGPRHAVDVSAAGTLVAVTPLGLLAADDPRVVATVEALRGHVLDDVPALYDLAHSGLAPAATLWLAAAEARAGDGRALDRLAWLLGAATAAWTWPTAIHPHLGGGCAGDGHDTLTAAALLWFVRDLLAHEVPGGLALSSLVPPAWLGQGWEVHDAPTTYGNLSYAVRWHGDRPALLWDLEAHEGVGPVRLTIPGLDPSWSTTEQRGETLLAAVAPPEARLTEAASVAPSPPPAEAPGTASSAEPPRPAAPPRPSGDPPPAEPGSLS
jgi:hypothetical protein